MTPDVGQAPEPAVPEPIELETLNHNQAEDRASIVPPTATDLTITSPASWHPRITPYRLSNILIPVCVGTSKAVVSQRSNSTAPVTLELVSGVVVFLVLFHAGYYESSQQIPHFIAWAFQTDCMEYLWRLFDFFSLPRPRYKSDEIHEFDIGSVVTSYRLLVSATVISFGLTKASLTYAGFSIVSTWVEWLLGVVITSALYILGLYESSSTGVLSNFFTVGHDRIYVLRYTGKKVSYSVLMGLGVLFTLSALRKDLIYPPNEHNGSQEPLKRPRTVYQFSLDMIPIVPQLIIGVALLLLGLLWGLSDIPGSQLALPVFRHVSWFILSKSHTIGHFLNIVACAVCLGICVVLPLALMNDMNSYGREPSDIFLYLIMWSGFIGIWAFILRFMWWSMKEFSKDVATGMRYVLFKWLAALNYAFWELGDAFRTSPV
ncbi:hypothetical protein GALMADRAFT_258406 [Galerina marginata CBS 339.88]|uniref:Uncharacterized protein n=1 Tax=Galerina marginata (strain CBS 339.88) TaxID=685588 RepID=A0A067S9B0_GALM3|nr:hypothetical protein GALMADRAFT_258406 [Galerina marginata CBS 339.88]